MKLPNVALYNFKKSSLGERKLLKKTLVDFYNANFLLSQWSEKYFNIFLDDKNARKMECFVLEKNKKTLALSWAGRLAI